MGWTPSSQAAWEASFPKSNCISSFSPRWPVTTLSASRIAQGPKQSSKIHFLVLPTEPAASFFPSPLPLYFPKRRKSFKSLFQKFNLKLYCVYPSDEGKLESRVMPSVSHSVRGKGNPGSLQGSWAGAG